MPTAVIYDPAQGLGALYDEEVGRALGPIVSGEGARETLEAFIDGLPVDAAKLMPHELDRLWSHFMDVLNEPGEAEIAALDELEAGEQREMEEDASTPLAQAASDATAASLQSQAPPATASASPAPQQVPCVHCNETGVVGGAPCPSCGGTGKQPLAL